MHTENLTILFVDIAGFTATTNRQSRRQNASLLQNFESLLKPQIKKFSGQLVKSIGDALLLTFRSPTDAMLCACRMQDRLALHRQQYPDEQPIVIRIAAHLGEVRTARHDIFGEAVNLASRIEAMTPPGEIYLSEAVFLAMNKTEVQVHQAGQFQLDGFDHPLTLYRVRPGIDTSLRYGTSPDEFAIKGSRLRPWLLAGLCLPLMIAGYFGWQQRPLPALPEQPVAPGISQFIELDLESLQSTSLTAAEKFGVSYSLEQAIKRIQGLYLYIPEAGSPARLKLTADWRYGVYPQPDQLEFHLSADNKRIKNWILVWQGNIAEIIRQIELQLAEQLTQNGDFVLLYPAEQSPTIPDSFYKQYLAALADLHHGEQTQNSANLQNAVQQLRQIRQEFADFSPADRALCLALTAWYALTDDTAQLDEAGPVCRRLSGSDIADQLAYGRYLTQIGDSQAAQQKLMAVLARNPKSAEAYTLLSRLYEADQQPLEAELILQRGITAQPNHWPALQMMALFHLERGQLSTAIEYLQRVIKLAPQNATALTNLGSAYLLNGQLQAAADTYQQALSKSPEPFIQANLATVFYYLGRINEAIGLYQSALQQNQIDYVLHGNIADAYRQNRQLPEAELHYQRAISLVQQRSSTHARDLALLAHYLAKTGQPEEAQRTMQRAFSKSKAIAEVWLLNAILQTQTGHLKDAITSAKQAQQLGYPAKLLAVDPDLQPLAADPAFHTLLNPTIKEKQ